MRARPTVSLIAALLIAAAVSLFAEETGGEPQEPFTSVELERFITDWKDLAQWAELADKVPELMPDPPVLGLGSVDQTLERFLSDRGWEPERFFYVASHALAALLVLGLSEQAPALIARLEQQKTMIEHDSRLSRKEKEQALADLDRAILEIMELDTDHKVPESEIELVRARRERIEEAFRLE